MKILFFILVVIPISVYGSSKSTTDSEPTFAQKFVSIYSNNTASHSNGLTNSSSNSAMSIAPPFFRMVSALQSNNTSVADSNIKILLHDLTHPEIKKIASGVYNALETGATDLYNAFTETQTFANVLESVESRNPEGALANTLPLSVLTETITMSQKVTGYITSTAFTILNFGINFKDLIETIKFVSTNSDELDMKQRYLKGIAKSVFQLASYCKDLANITTTLNGCMLQIEKAVNGTIFFTKDPDRDIRKINEILMNIENDFLRLHVSFTAIYTEFQSHIQHTTNQSSIKIMLTDVVRAFGGPTFDTMEGAIDLFGRCQDLNKYVNNLVKKFGTN